jgi:mRNA-degrading endonuclease RelE of RelBE toxin-antitoxin system
MTVVETDRFLKDVRDLMPESEAIKLVSFIATNPQAGDVVPETGGVRKLRWSLPGRGKRGGARVIYYFHSERLPIFLLTAYGKNEKANLTRAERHRMAKLIPMLVQGYPGKPGRKA